MNTHQITQKELVNEALKRGGFKTKKETINQALQEFIQRKKQQEIIKLFNTLEYADEINGKAQQNAIQKVINDFYALPISKIETFETNSVYQGKVLSLDEMQQAIAYEVSLYQ